MECQANGGGSTPVIFTGWSTIFLLVDIFKALPQIHNLKKNLTPLPNPRYATSFCFAAREFYCWIFLCVLWFPGAEAGSNTWCGRHSPLKICRFSPTNASMNLCRVTACGHLVLLLERALHLTLSQR